MRRGPWRAHQIGLVDELVARAEELAERYGERFTPPASLRATATSGGTYEEVQP